MVQVRVGWAPCHSVLDMHKWFLFHCLSLLVIQLHAETVLRIFWQLSFIKVSNSLMLLEILGLTSTCCYDNCLCSSNDNSLNYNPSFSKDAYLRDYNYYSRWHRSDTVPRNKMPRFQSPLSTKDCT